MSSGDLSQRIEQLLDSLDTDDVGQKRYTMFTVFDMVLEKLHEEKDVELPSASERLENLREFDGYMYKLAQDFLTSSSTVEKQKKIEKMVERVL